MVKHAYYIPGNDPPMDITIFMDVALNPGPSNDNHTSNTESTGDVDIITMPTTLYMYSRNQLINLRSRASRLKPEQFQILKLYSLFRYRGKSAGKRKRLSSAFYKGNALQQLPELPIQVIIGNRHSTYPICSFRMPSSIKQLPKQVPSSTCTTSTLPRFLLTNARSVLNKLDELELRLNNEQTDVAVITESWITPDTSAEQYSVVGYNVFNKCRPNRNGGGVLLYVKEHLRATAIDDDIHVPPEIEGEWIILHHPKFPRCVPSIVVFAVYSPPDSQHEDLLRHHIICSVDRLLVRKPCIGIALLGDFNKVDIRPICNGNNLVQIVNKPTRQDAILDLIITNFSHRYQSPTYLLLLVGVIIIVLHGFPKMYLPAIK